MLLALVWVALGFLLSQLPTLRREYSMEMLDGRMPVLETIDRLTAEAATR